MKTPRIEILPTDDGQFYYCLIASNGEKLCWSESYTRRRDAVRATFAFFAAVAQMLCPGQPIDAEEVIDYLIGEVAFEVTEDDEEADYFVVGAREHPVSVELSRVSIVSHADKYGGQS